MAKVAGVSISTVSNALNDVDVLHPDTKAHIIEVAKQLNYVPNINGKLLKSGKTKMIGFFTTSISGPYFYKLVETMALECEKLGYNLNIFVTSDKNFILASVLGKRVDGLIIFEENYFSDQEINILKNSKINAVFLDRLVEDQTISSFIFDSFAGGYQATEYLIEMGHKKIGFISGVDNTYDGLQRKQGYKIAMEKHQLSLDEALVLKGDFEEKTSYESVATFLENHPEKVPDAFVAANDVSAIGCMNALKDAGLRVPEDVSVLGFDDIDISKYYQPKLTTMRNPIERQGELAIQQLIKQMEKQEPGQAVCLEGELMIRESCQAKIKTE